MEVSDYLAKWYKKENYKKSFKSYVAAEQAITKPNTINTSESFFQELKKILQEKE